MILKKIKIEEKYDYMKDILVSFCLFCFASVINSGISIKGLYMDDLYMWSTRRGVSFFRYIFPKEMSKFRPVYWVVAWIYQGILRNNLGVIVPVNILIGTGIAIGVYFFAQTLSKSKLPALIIAILFLVSRFSYYDIGQFLGIMESMAIIFATLMLYFLYRYINSDNNIYFYYACTCFFLNCFTHERFIVLFPMLIFTIIIKSGNRIINVAITVTEMTVVIIIRLLALRSFIPEGTGGTEISETFSVSGFLASLRSEILYLFGVNTGPEHLNGINFADVNIIIKCCIATAFIFLVLFVIKFIIAAIMYSEKFEIKWTANILLFLGFIIGSIVASSVTIRVEMRWLYAPYLFLLLLISYIYGIDKELKSLKKTGVSLSRIFDISFLSMSFFIIWAFCVMVTDIYYRGFYNKIYLFEGQHRANSLADATYYKYKGELTDKKIYIIKNDFKLSEFDSLEFFRTFDINIREDIVTFIDSYRDIGQIDDDMIVIAEDKKNNEYIDITSFLKNIKTENLYGHYDDGWTDEEAQMNIMSGEKGKIQLEIMYPGELTGNESIELDVNGNVENLSLSSNITYYDIYTTANTVVPLHLKSNFIMPDAKEQRGEKKLSFILNIKSE